MPTKKKVRPKFLYLHFESRELLRQESKKATLASKRFVSQSQLADKILTVLRNRPKLLKEVLKNAR